MTAPIFLLEIQQHFVAAMRLVGVNSQCANLHGHTYHVRAQVAGHNLDTHGMLIDHTVVNKALEKIIQTLDHRYLNDHSAFKNTPPTSEHIARYIYKTLQADIDDIDVTLKAITISENPHVQIRYEE